ncbi:hypothetical protein CXB51_007049 [Gossypium anomalum]|uniref:RNase H type-1 domain-containing protein n=1 Tax=Gossypium anomalum TaxID=47600 RepID=A0A8J5ZA71_9ROSI|nr:hypothetical protein CXB51_007049 [Gossypium anomalum]
MGSLISKIPAFSNLDLDCRVRDLVNLDGSWNVDLLHVWLPEDVVCKIISIPPPHPDSGPDRVRLLTNSERFRRELGACSSCALCGHTNEDLAHVLRDCSFAKNVWMLILPEQLKQRLFSSPFPYWFSLNLSFLERLQDSGLSWSCLFGVVVWRIWKNRNLFIFQNLSWSATKMVRNSSCWARQYESRMGSIKNSYSSSNSVTFSNDSWVSLHTDGAMVRDSGYAASGGMARDKEGNWIVGFSRFLGVCSPFEVELWGVLNGILILLNKGYRQILILSDNLEVVKSLSVLDLEESGITNLRRTQRIMKTEGKWIVRHIPRAQNLVEDHLAKFGLNWKSSLHVFNEAPKEVIDLLKKDKDNGCFMPDLNSVRPMITSTLKYLSGSLNYGQCCVRGVYLEVIPEFCLLTTQSTSRGSRSERAPHSSKKCEYLLLVRFKPMLLYDACE